MRNFNKMSKFCGENAKNLFESQESLKILDGFKLESNYANLICMINNHDLNWSGAADDG